MYRLTNFAFHSLYIRFFRNITWKQYQNYKSNIKNKIIVIFKLIHLSFKFKLNIII